jgi:hypothetical protein
MNSEAITYPTDTGEWITREEAAVQMFGSKAAAAMITKARRTTTKRSRTA